MDVVSAYTYSKLREIGVGQGRNSKVYLADDPQLGGQVAVKEIEKVSFALPVSDFFAEAKSMFKSEHPNVVAIRVASETATHVCLSMPYYKNGSLADKIQGGPLELSEIQRVGQHILSGLAAIHAANTIHFDVKPSNILFSDRGMAMVADFGQARTIGPTGVITMPQMYRHALPPEFFLTGVGTVQSDVFQAGLTLYRAVNGEPFFAEQVAQITDLAAPVVSGKFPDRDKFLPHVPKRLRTVIRKAMAVDPKDRHGSATELARDLGSVEFSHQWKTSLHPNGEYTWESIRYPRSANLAVSLRKNGRQWDVEIHTVGSKRKASRTTLWRSGQARGTAFAHLKKVFESLE